MQDAAAAAHRQVERRADFGIAGDARELRRQVRGVAAAPHHDRALLAQIAKIDPRRAARQAVDQHFGLVRRIVREIAAVPHRADDVTQFRSGGVVKALRQRRRQRVARIEHRAIAVIDERQHRVIDDKDDGEDGEHDAPVRDHVGKSRAVERGARHQHDPKPDKKPQRIAPHGKCAAAADGNQRDHGEAGAEGEQRHDAAVEGVGE